MLIRAKLRVSQIQHIFVQIQTLYLVNMKNRTFEILVHLPPAAFEIWIQRRNNCSLLRIQYIHGYIKTLRYRRNNLCHNRRNSFALCLRMVRSKLHTWILLSSERIHMGTHEIMFFSNAPLFSLYEQTIERQLSMRHIIPALWYIIWNIFNPGNLLHLFRHPRAQLRAT